jgi:3-isopropylmalate/(R)-2-methylmalate dehydratase small subunit
MNKIAGKAVVHNCDDISTDQIFPGQYVNLTDPAEIAEHVLEGADRSLKDRLHHTGNILVVGSNFGCGSSREQAVISLLGAGVAAVIVSSAGRIWYRNAINLALPVIVCKGLSSQVTEGEALEIDLVTGVIQSHATGRMFQGEPLSQFVLNIFRNGGVKPMMLQKHAVK